jgi:cobalamin biosynthesis Mg chelatase CobN
VAYTDEFRDHVLALGRVKDMGMEIAADQSRPPDAIAKIQAHVAALKSQNILYGLHKFGRVPSLGASREPRRCDREHRLPDTAGVLAESMTA